MLRPRFKLITALVIVALAAVVLSLIETIRRQRLAEQVAVEHQRLEKRAQWAARMQTRGYLSGRQVDAARAEVTKFDASVRGVRVPATKP
jgi:type II secretory pathway component PulK